MAAYGGASCSAKDSMFNLIVLVSGSCVPWWKLSSLMSVFGCGNGLYQNAGDAIFASPVRMVKSSAGRKIRAAIKPADKAVRS